MPTIGWVFLALAFALVLGSLFMLRDSADKMKISEEKMEKIRKRKAEVEAREKAEEDDK
jgi:hypothetical protein